MSYLCCSVTFPFLAEKAHEVKNVIISKLKKSNSSAASREITVAGVGAAQSGKISLWKVIQKCDSLIS